MIAFCCCKVVVIEGNDHYLTYFLWFQNDVMILVMFINEGVS